MTIDCQVTDFFSSMRCLENSLCTKSLLTLLSHISLVSWLIVFLMAFFALGISFLIAVNQAKWAYKIIHLQRKRVQITVFNVQLIMYPVQCTVYKLQCTILQYTANSVQYTVYNIQCTVNSVQCTFIGAFI